MNIKSIIGIFVAVDILVTTLLACLAINLLPQGWWSVSPAEVLAIVIIAYAVLSIVLIATGCAIKATVMSIFDKLGQLRSAVRSRFRIGYYSYPSVIHYHHFVPVAEEEYMPDAKDMHDFNESQDNDPDCDCDECQAKRRE